MNAASKRNLHRLRLSQLQLVCLLSETGSMRTASERLHLSAPALSKSLREVESMAGASLFERSAQGMKPTASGEAFIRHARGILQRVPALGETANAQGIGVRTTFRLGTAPFIAWKMLPPALLEMAGHADLPRFHLVESRIVPLAEQLVNGELDAVLTLFTPEAIEVFGNTALALEQVRSERLFVVTAKGDRDAGRGATWKKLANRDWILPPASYTARILVQRAYLAAGLLPPEPHIESIDIPAMLALVKAGLGITPAFESTVREDLAAGTLRRVRMEEELPAVPIGLAYRKAASDASTIAALRDALKHTSKGEKP